MSEPKLKPSIIHDLLTPEVLDLQVAQHALTEASANAQNADMAFNEAKRNKEKADKDLANARKRMKDAINRMHGRKGPQRRSPQGSR